MPVSRIHDPKSPFLGLLRFGGERNLTESSSSSAGDTVRGATHSEALT